MPATAAKGPRYAAAHDLAQRITWGKPQPKLTAEIAACECPDATRAGLYLLNGDWEAAHTTAQELHTALGSHWHALVHRHEPDPDNSKYWLHRTGKSPIYPELAKAAQAAGQSDAVAPKGVWNADRFTDAFSATNAPAWTRELDALELRLLLEHSLSI
ncbi:MAG TPA: hypothetical protein VF678_06920 [bacterium]